MPRLNLIRSLNIALLFCLTSAASQAADSLIDEIQLKDPSANIVRFSPQVDTPYFAIHSLSEPFRNKGTAIIFHDIGEHADWPEVVHTLRKTLPRHGWSSLSIQLPSEGKNDISSAYKSQLRNALDKTINGDFVIISKGASSESLVELLPANYINSALAFVLISHSEDMSSDRLVITDIAKQIGSTPILDIYAEHDRPTVVTSAGYRMNAVKQFAKENNQVRYQQINIKSGHYHFRHQQRTLIKRIAGWLNRYAKRQTIIADTNSTNKKSED